MKPEHHISEAVLTAYAAGTLDEAFALVVACHLSMCDRCRAEAEALDTLGGSLLETMPEAAMGDGAIDATWSRIERRIEDGDDQAPAAPSHQPGAVFPGPLRDYVGGDAGAVAWRSVGGGVRQKILDCEGKATARLLYIPAGKAVPDHGHRGLELTLVLQGSFSDDVARFGRGDVEIGDPDLDHQPIADPGPDCICLAATDAPLRFKGLIPRIFQPFLQI